MNENIYKNSIASVLRCSPENVFLYWKGRVALYAALKAMGVKEGNEIILPAFTCVVVPNSIIYLGAKPVYVDINPNNYNVSIEKLKEAITNKTKVIICQNTFGLSSNIEQIVQIAKEHNLFTIEDCTHGFGGFYNGKPNGSFCDAAFYSTQWNKPFSTGVGGFLVVNNKSLIEKVNDLEREKLKPTFIDKFTLSFLIPIRKYFVNEFTQNILVKIFRFLSKHNLIIGSSQGKELSGTEIPYKFFKNISTVQINEGINQIKHLDEVNLLRKKNAQDYSSFLKANNKNFVKENLFNNHLFLKYPLLVKDRERFSKLAQKQNISLGDWFISPLHPIKENLERWNFNKVYFPEAVKISSMIVNLPTDIKNNQKVLSFLKNNLDLIV